MGLRAFGGTDIVEPHSRSTFSCQTSALSEARVKWILASLLAVMIASPLWAQGPATPLVGLSPESHRACVDAKVLDADCGVDPPQMHECFAADRFGRCPGDPSCFDAQGVQARCTWPVVRRDGPCFNGKVVSPNALPPRCRKG